MIYEGPIKRPKYPTGPFHRYWLFQRYNAFLFTLCFQSQSPKVLRFILKHHTRNQIYLTNQDQRFNKKSAYLYIS
ncbi:unnamed protein product [Acanthoscelides obtectus]|uniref:Uncharacterized protein n=1 Tax=Acanthoscelides obtectus TaxID=200917 RepID=A0A9P0M068_ACAOB|nr:unnamed protein product [Acanthoscelides obtectus]CAK1641089.1 hypothetical protein AOBTE_LOCUS12142 [Acanthoscelides obtectus]